MSDAAIKDGVYVIEVIGEFQYLCGEWREPAGPYEYYPYGWVWVAGSYEDWPAAELQGP